MKTPRKPSPARSQGAVRTPIRHKHRRCLSVSSAQSNGSSILSALVHQRKTNASFAVSPLGNRKSILSDNTEIEEPKRKSWWKNLGEHSRNIELLEEDNISEPNNILEELDMEILSQDNEKNNSLDLPESSGSESINSIVIPQRKLLTQKDNLKQKKFSQIVEPRESLSKLHRTAADKTLVAGARDLFQNKQRSRPIFPAALLNISPNKTAADKTKEFATAEPKAQVRNIFGNETSDTRRKNIFNNFIVSESEDEITDIQPKVIGFQMKVEGRRRFSSQGVRDLSPTSSITTDMELDDWKMLPSSTMVEKQLEALMFGPSPKRARLSKLSEIESETGSNATKQSNKSSSKQDKSRKSKTFTKEKMHEIDQDKIVENVDAISRKSKTFIKEKTHIAQEETVEKSDTKSPITNSKEKALEQFVQEEIIDFTPPDEEHLQNDSDEKVEDSDMEENERLVLEDDEEQEEEKRDNDDEQIESCMQEHNENEAVIQLSNEIDGNLIKNRDNKAIDSDKNQEEEQDIATKQNENANKSEAVIQSCNEIASNLSKSQDEQAIDGNKNQEEEQDACTIQNECEIDNNSESVIQSCNENDDNLNNSQENAVNDDSKNHEESIENEVEEDTDAEQNENVIQDNDENNESENEDDDKNETEIESGRENDDLNRTQNNEDNVSNNQNESTREEVELDAEQNKSGTQDNEQQDESENENSDESEAAIESCNESEDNLNNSLGNESIVSENQEESVQEEENQDSDDGENESGIQDNEEQNDSENEEQSNNENDDNPNEEESLDEVMGTPNISHDTTGRNRNKNKSPEAVRHDSRNLNNSYYSVKGDKTARKTEMLNSIQRELVPARESIGFSDGTDNSSAQGSGWDSHRTTRKTLRQTYGREFTPRKSLRALVMEKSAKRQTQHNEIASVTTTFPQANSTEMPSTRFDDDNDIENQAPNEISFRTRQTTLEKFLLDVKKKNAETRQKIEEEVRNSLSASSKIHVFKIPAKSFARKAAPKPKKSNVTSNAKTNKLFGEMPPEFLEDMKYKPPKRFQPRDAPWITKHLYKFLEAKLEPKYHYKARVRAEKLVENVYNFAKDLRRRDVASSDSVDVLKREMARLDIVKTHFDFYEFFHSYMPREVRIKVNPDVINKIPLPRHGVFADIL